jgi:hypothetical protein
MLGLVAGAGLVRSDPLTEVRGFHGISADGRKVMAKTVIIMSNRPAVMVSDEKWPVIAEGFYSYHDGEVECQANRKWKCEMKVRQSADGKTIVYGMFDYDSHYSTEPNDHICAGLLLENGDADVLSGIAAVSIHLHRGIHTADISTRNRVIRCAADMCVDDLPPEDLG